MGTISKADQFEASLLNMGIRIRKTTKRGFKRASTSDLGAAQQRAFAPAFSDLGGLEEARGVFTAGDWDLADDDGMFLEFDEASHFHRYRALTLTMPWSVQLPWAEDYHGYCANYEGKARVDRRFWTWPAEKQFGTASPKRDFTGNGGPRWKQRALYDAVRDAVALHTDGIGLIRISVYDKIDGVPLRKLLKPGKLLDPGKLAELVKRRRIPAALAEKSHAAPHYLRSIAA